jgi:hypothetical protein
MGNMVIVRFFVIQSASLFHNWQEQYYRGAAGSQSLMKWQGYIENGRGSSYNTQET